MSAGDLEILPDDQDTFIGLEDQVTLAIWLMLAYGADLDDVSALKCKDIDLVRKTIRFGEKTLELYNEVLNNRLLDHLDFTLSLQTPFGAVVDEWGPELVGQIDPEIPLFWRPPGWTSLRGNIERALARIAELHPQSGKSK